MTSGSEWGNLATAVSFCVEARVMAAADRPTPIEAKGDRGFDWPGRDPEAPFRSFEQVFASFEQPFAGFEQPFASFEQPI